MKKLLFIPLLLILLSLPRSATAEEYVTQQILQDTLQRAQALEIPDFNFAETTQKVASGQLSFRLDSILQYVLNLLTKELKTNANLLVKILVISVLTGVLCNLQHAAPESSIADVSFLACFAVVAGLSVTLMAQITEIANTTIDNLMLFIAGLMPVMGSLSLSASVSSAMGFYPGLFAAMQTFVAVCKNLFLPLISATTALSVINALSGRFHITRLIEFSRHIVKWGLGLLLTVFVSILGLHSFTSGAVSVAGRTAKYAISNFIPLVGGVLAESAEVVLRSMRLIRGAIGITGTIALLSICCLPVIKILATSVLYRFAAAILEPATDQRIVRFLIDLSGNITLTFSIMLMVTVMFIISVAMLSALAF